MRRTGWDATLFPQISARSEQPFPPNPFAGFPWIDISAVHAVIIEQHLLPRETMAVSSS